MIIYEVNLDINPEIVMDFNDWLDVHIQKMLEHYYTSQVKE